ncbi:hypothetical protein TSUD_324420 [Trifolium subterraneum]|uniref:Uncharacterized protein n=1 Tax=Trifolium subterraneum TaxID=3900 RepID=A0A2Z6MGL4_TRISU|nr:hypothetical protein TSUD_324420 [Trifolium subterraneum]
MLRCDVARVKVVTGNKKIIDSSMSVKVKGQRFEIRIIEETGTWDADGRWFGGINKGFGDEISSKASSGGGFSAAAVVEGFSESGSDADVSDSCKVLLETEKRGGARLENDDNLVKQKSTLAVVSERTPHFFGNTVELVEGEVNSATDKGEEPICIELACADSACVGPLLDSNKMTPGDEKSPNEFLGGDVEEHVRPLVGVIGPAQVDSFGHVVPIEKGACEYDMGCKSHGMVRSGPEILRTKKGDLFVFGANHLGPAETSKGGKECRRGGEAQQTTSCDSIENSEDSGTSNNCGRSRRGIPEALNRSKGGKKKKTSTKNINNLPFSMLRKLPRSFHGKRRDSSREGYKKGSGSNQRGEITSGSDPTRILVETNSQQTPVVSENEGISLEVVLLGPGEEGEPSSTQGGGGKT